MHGMYNPYFVFISFVTAILASYTSLNLAARIRFIDTKEKRHYWLVGGALSLGLGIWSMHFIGMIAMRMPMTISYDPWITAVSLLIAVITSYAALEVMTRRAMTRLRTVFAGLLIGIGICGMHYAGMAAMRLYPVLHFRPLPFALSIGLAPFFAWTALAIAPRIDDPEQRNVVSKRCLAALLMGLAIVGMHYIGMTAAIIPEGTVSVGKQGMGPSSLVLIVCVLSSCALAMTIVLSALETKFDRLMIRSNLTLADANQRLQVLARTDTLTGIANRTSFIEYTERRILDARQDQRPFSIIFLDLDSFKNVNDLLGHAAGDELLKMFADALQIEMRAGDTVARLGGDEFVILLEGVGNKEDVEPIANKVLELMQNDFMIHDVPLRMTASLGIAVYPRDGVSVTDLLKNADTAMYDARQRGRNTYRFFNPAMVDGTARVLRIHRGLANALEKNQFTLAFQGKFGGPQTRLVGAEALLRWSHPELGDLSPMDFIPIAEQTGQIAQISEWVIAETCRQMQEWRLRGLPEVKVAINLSPEQLRQERYVERISEIISRFGIGSHQVMFEVTESVAMKEPAMAGKVIRQFQDAGFEFALDDFGIGYSSMAYLQQFHATQLKIDRVFIDGLDGEERKNMAIVSAIIALAHSLDMTVVAEGVETITQLQKLNEMGCDEVQGYLLSKPLAAEEFMVFLRAQTDRERSNVVPIDWAMHRNASA